MAKIESAIGHGDSHPGSVEGENPGAAMYEVRLDHGNGEIVQRPCHRFGGLKSDHTRIGTNSIEAVIGDTCQMEPLGVPAFNGRDPDIGIDVYSACGKLLLFVG